MIKNTTFAVNGEQECDHDLDPEVLAILEPFENDDTHCLKQIITNFQLHLSQKASCSLGYHVNLNCNHYIALSPLLRFHINNVGDPFHESNLAMHAKNFEVAVLDWFAKLWGIAKDEYWGYVTNGGTEGNLQGILLGRELLRDGILYTSKESHYSIFKAARICQVNCEVVDTLITGEMDCNDLNKKLILNRDKPAIINVNIGTTFKGGVDSLDHVIETLYQCGFSDDRFYIHCDAALNGVILPFIKQGVSLDFSKPIGSISVSGHKLIGSPMPCAVCITRKRYIKLLSKKIEYIDTSDTTISGSRNGHAPIFLWYALSIKGHSGLRRDIILCFKNARYLRDGLKNAGISVMLNKNSNIVVFERPIDKDFVKHWQLSCQGNIAHVVVMPHVTTSLLDEFLDDLVQKRSTWYGSDRARHLCVADEIGSSNCACSMHHKDDYPLSTLI